MLRISRSHETAEGGGRWLRLEGSLSGPWVSECRAVCAREEEPGGEPLALDLSELRFADAEGVRFLREMSAAGRVARSSRFVAELMRTEGSR